MNIRHLPRPACNSSGFGIVEVLMAALLIMVVMMSVSRTVMIGMAANRLGASRINIESEILNDIELIQGIDSETNMDTSTGCANPSAYVASVIAARNPEPANNQWDRRFDVFDSNILVVIYSFHRPENPSHIERRITEINPSLQANCP